MRSGVDYGAIPGTGKPTLLKPGAERLTTYFGLTPTFTLVEKIEDWGGQSHGGEPFFYYWYRCHLGRQGQLVAEADGSCNSRESRYRWRWVAEEDLPPGLPRDGLKARRAAAVEFAFAVDKGETTGQYGKPAAYWQRFQEAIASGTARPVKKVTRAGRQLDAWEIDTALYRVPNEEIPGQVNTIQKIAQKRALVAATLATLMTGALAGLLFHGQSGLLGI